jgi:anti-anti-sigma regulatory factor
LSAAVADERAQRPFHLTDDGDGVLVLVGELDLAGAAILRDRLSRRPAVLVLDGHAVSFIDAAGLRALEAAELPLRDPSTAVRRLLDVVGMPAALTVDRGHGQGESTVAD